MKVINILKCFISVSQLYNNANELFNKIENKYDLLK